MHRILILIYNSALPLLCSVNSFKILEKVSKNKLFSPFPFKTRSFQDFQVEASEPSTPTLTPEVTIRETIPKPTPSPSTPQKSPVPPQEGTVIPPKVSYPDTVLAGLPEADKKVREF